MVIVILLLILVVIFILYRSSVKEGFWYYPNCMETAFGGTRCYPYYYPNRFSYPLFPWYYPYTYYYPYF